jgi:chemotaxis response regulator CheB
VFFVVRQRRKPLQVMVVDISAVIGEVISRWIGAEPDIRARA